jgi:anti-sigma B factor antagonist
MARISPSPSVPSPQPRFRVTERALDERTTVVAVSGEIHVSTAHEFSSVLTASIDAGGRLLVLDLTNLAFIDSTGLSVLLNALRRVTHAGGRMTVVCSNPTVLRLFEITRLDSTFDIHPGLEPALARVQAAAGGSDAGIP